MAFEQCNHLACQRCADRSALLGVQGANGLSQEACQVERDAVGGFVRVYRPGVNDQSLADRAKAFGEGVRDQLFVKPGMQLRHGRVLQDSLTGNQDARLPNPLSRPR